jgi:hypothetical protein
MAVDYQGWRTGEGSRSEYKTRGGHRFTPFQVRIIALGYEAKKSVEDIAKELASPELGSQQIAKANPSKVRYIVNVCGGMAELLQIYVSEWPLEKRRELADRYEREERERKEKKKRKA